MLLQLYMPLISVFLLKKIKLGERELGAMLGNLLISTKGELNFPRVRPWSGVGSSVQAVGGCREVPWIKIVWLKLGSEELALYPTEH